MGKRYNKYDYYDYYEKTTPIEVENGIALQTQRGEVATQWWSKKWIHYLKSLNMGARLTRGKSYARKGQIMSLKIGQGKVVAKVQGSSRNPYIVEIQLKAISTTQWKKLVKLLTAQAIFVSKLLNGTMPQDIEKVFIKAEVELFPSSREDLVADCSCPDYANPCKHIAAVYYILAEKFDENPFLIFELRGKSKEDLLLQLRESRTDSVAENSNPTDAGIQKISSPRSQKKNKLLEKDVLHYWQGTKTNNSDSISLSPSNLNAELLTQIDPSPLNLENRNFSDILRQTYISLMDRTLEKMNEIYYEEKNQEVLKNERNNAEKQTSHSKPDKLKKISNEDLSRPPKITTVNSSIKPDSKTNFQEIDLIVAEKDLTLQWNRILNLMRCEQELSDLSQKSIKKLLKTINILIGKWTEDKAGTRPDPSIVQAILISRDLIQKNKTSAKNRNVESWEEWFHHFWKKNFRLKKLKKEFRAHNLSIVKKDSIWTLEGKKEDFKLIHH